jgi:hypothetical protein
MRETLRLSQKSPEIKQQSLTQQISSHCQSPTIQLSVLNNSSKEISTPLKICARVSIMRNIRKKMIIFGKYK